MNLALASYTLWWREQVRFFRQGSRVFGALVQPLMFWALFGSGLRASFRPPVGGGQMGYLEYFFPGTVIMILLFTAIFSTISVIEDRREGFLQGVLVAPVPRSAVVLGKVLGGTTLAVLQGTLILALGPLAGIRLTPISFVASVAIQLIVAFALTALSFCIAWRMESTQGFHAIMNLFLMPMWFLSGALFPAEQAWAPIKWVMRCNPLSYGYNGLCQALYLNDPSARFSGLPLSVNFAIAIFSALLLFAFASMIASGIPTSAPRPTMTTSRRSMAMPERTRSSTTPKGVHGRKIGSPRTIIPTLTGVSASTSLAAEIARWTGATSICGGSGSCTIIPWTSGSAFRVRT